MHPAIHGTRAMQDSHDGYADRLPSCARRTPLRLAVVVFGLLLLCVRSAEAVGVAVLGRYMYVNGERFFAKGMNYGPTPPGQWPDSKDQSQPWDWIETTSLHERDLPLLKEMNVNVIRLYNWRVAEDHSAFLDACYNHSIYVFITLEWKWDLYNSGAAGIATMKSNVAAIVQDVASHPAVFGFMIGNELNLNRGYEPAVWDTVRELRDEVHRNEGFDFHPVCSPVADGFDMEQIIREEGNSVDIWCLQVYRGRSYFSLFQDFWNWSPRPLLITETGVDSLVTGQSRDAAERLQSQWMADLWDENVIYSKVSSGAMLFAYVDEWFKCGVGSGYRLDTFDACGFYAPGTTPDNAANPEYYGLMAIDDSKNITAPYTYVLRAKPAYCHFRSLWNGTTNTLALDRSGCPSTTALATLFTQADTTLDADSPASAAGGVVSSLSVSGPSSVVIRFALRSLYTALGGASVIGEDVLSPPRNAGPIVLTPLGLSVATLRYLAGGSTQTITLEANRLIESAELVLWRSTTDRFDDSGVVLRVEDRNLPTSDWRDLFLTYQDLSSSTIVSTRDFLLTASSEDGTPRVRLDVTVLMRRRFQAILDSLSPSVTANASNFLNFSSLPQDISFVVSIPSESQRTLRFYSRESDSQAFGLTDGNLAPRLKVSLSRDIVLDPSSAGSLAIVTGTGPPRDTGSASSSFELPLGNVVFPLIIAGVILLIAFVTFAIRHGSSIRANPGHEINSRRTNPVRKVEREDASVDGRKVRGKGKSARAKALTAASSAYAGDRKTTPGGSSDGNSHSPSADGSRPGSRPASHAGSRTGSKGRPAAPRPGLSRPDAYYLGPPGLK